MVIKLVKKNEMAPLYYKSATGFKISLITQCNLFKNPVYNMVSFCLSPDNYLKSLLGFFFLFSNNINEILNTIFSSMCKQVRGHKSHSEKRCLKITGRKLSHLFAFNSHPDRYLTSSCGKTWCPLGMCKKSWECLSVAWSFADFGYFFLISGDVFLVFKKKKNPKKPTYKSSVSSTVEMCCCLLSIFQNQEVD